MGAMTHRQRILAAIEHEPVDRVPTDMWATIEVQELLFSHLGITAGKAEQSRWIGLNGGPLSRGIEGIIELFDRLEIDGIFDIHPPYIGPELKRENDITYNEWGFGYKRTDYGKGSYDEQLVFPLEGIDSLEELEQWSCPDPDWYDYQALPSLIDQCGTRAVSCGYSAIFTYHTYLRGMERALTDPLLDPEFCSRLIGKLSDFFTEYHSRCFEAAGDRIDLTQVTDDWGGQNGLMTSTRIFEEFYKEPMRRAVELAKEYGIKVFHHDDGDMRQLLPQMVELGIDLLNPIQWRCGDWDLEALKAEYGKKVCFHSAVDNQETLPLGTAAEVDSQVRMLIETLACDRTGFILGPCHNLQPNTSVENILALYEAAVKYGRFS